MTEDSRDQQTPLKHLVITKFILTAGIYRWRIILEDTNFFQQSVSVLPADFRDRNNRPSAKHIFIKFYVHTLAHVTL